MCCHDYPSSENTKELPQHFPLIQKKIIPGFWAFEPVTIAGSLVASDEI
jgi:hypothetical protein